MDIQQWSPRELANYLVRVRLPRTRLRPGYDEAEVDVLLNEIDAALRGIVVPVAAEDLEQAEFTRTWLTRSGYAREEVDRLLGAVREYFREGFTLSEDAAAEAEADLDRLDRDMRFAMQVGMEQQFTPSGLRPGYRQGDVHGFCHRVAMTLLGGADDPVTAEELETTSFRVTRLGLGYDQEELDRFLDTVREYFRERSGP